MSKRPDSRDLLLARFKVRVRPMNATGAGILQERFGPFLVNSDGSPDLDLEVRPDLPTPDTKPGDLRVEWALEDQVLSFASEFEEARIDLGKRRGVVHLAPLGDLENLLRVYIAVQCVRNGGLLLHASGVVRGGEAHIFFGPSGAGKSTVARISASLGYSVLGDDVVALRKLKDTWRAFSLPFGTREGMGPLADINAPIAGIYRLRKGPSVSLAAMPLAEAIAELLAAAPFVHAGKGLSDRVLAECQSLAASVPTKELWFKPDAPIWDLLGSRA